MSNLANGFAAASELSQALIADLGGTVSPHAARTPWDPALLRRVEAALARHVGPIAAVLVRRSAPACDDLGTLCERLAEQVTHPGRAGESPAPDDAGPATIPGSLVAASTSVLARSLGPIAAVVARRAATTAPDRAAYFGMLEAAIADPQKRHAVRAQLDGLH